MPIVVNTNTTAVAASFNLSHANDALRKSLSRLSSGKRIVSPSDDAGGMAVAYKLNSKLKRTEAVRHNVQNGISYLQVQDGALSTIAKIADRMSELRTMAADVTKNTGDVENYSKEFIELQRQLNQVRHQKFNGISLFATSSSPASTTAPELRPQLDKQGLTLDDQGRGYAKFSRQILTTADGVVADGHVSLNVVNLQYLLSIGQADSRYISAQAATDVGAGQTAESITGRAVYLNLGNVDNGNQDDFGGAGNSTFDELYTADGYLSSILFVSMGNFIDVIERVADARAENAAEINRLNTTSALLVQNQTNLEAA
ncbi:MAG: flagellin, partial [Verrucomicrobiota bacterium]|nr:flagellin [Verrucomicrobiota bacterium]